MTIYQNLIAGSGFLQGPTGATGPAANTNITIYEYVATAGQTTFTGVDTKLQTLAYTPTGIFVTLNGSVLNDNTDFIATNGTSLVLTQAAVAGDELNIYAFPAFNVSGTYTQAETNSLLNTKLNLTGGTLTGNVSFANGANLLVPVGNTAQRPTAGAGYIRFNSDYGTLESANGTAWANVGSGGGSSSSAANVTSLTGNVYISAAGGLIDSSLTGGGWIIPTGNTAQRPANAANGTIRWNSSNNWCEMYTGSNTGWVVIAYGGQYTVTYLVVAGGGGGGGRHGGGGGAGGLITGTRLVVPGTTYSVSVGSGGSGTNNTSGGSNGSNTTALGYTAIGGGQGATYADSSNSPSTGQYAAAGGSGGGGGNGGYGTGASGTAGQGNAGGSTTNANGGGGGGAGATGPNGGPTGGTGGIGILFSTDGYGYYYAAGGGGGGWGAAAGPGGVGGGGGGAASNDPSSPAPGAGSGGLGGRSLGGAGTAGVNNTTYAGSGGTNTGSGGGGGAQSYPPYNEYTNGGNGGSGIVIITYPGIQRATGGTITANNGQTIHTFTAGGTFTA